GQRPAVRIRANVQALAARGLSLDSLRTAIASSNANGAKGSFDGPTRSWSIESNDQLSTAADYSSLVIAYKDGAPVRVRDVAQVVDASENTRVGAWMNRTPAIIVDIRRQPGANVIATADAIKKALPDLQRALPDDVHVTLLTDRTTGIRASVRDVQIELVFAVVLVTLAIFLFLGSPQATVVASVAVPLSLIGTFAAMDLLGFSRNNLTLMALTIASGFVVDDAIVVIENIARHIEDGLSPFAAALRGSREIGFTIISLTVSLVAVLIPLLFMGDVVGRLFREFAVTLAITILISAVVALTFVPMLSSRWLKSEAQTKTPRLAAKGKQAFEWLAHHYSGALDWVLERRTATLLVFAATVALTALLFVFIPKGLFPEQDTGQLQAVIATEQGISFGRMADLQQQVADALLKDPDVLSLSSNVGVDGQNPTLNSGRLLINLKDKKSRTTNQEEAIARLRDRAAKAVAGATLYLRPVQDLTIDAEGGPTTYRFALQGADQDQINQWAGKLQDELGQLPQLARVTSDVQLQGNAVTVEINRDVAARLGVSASAVDSALYNAFGQRIISTIFTQASQYRVILESSPGMLTDPKSLQSLYVSGTGGTAMPLDAFATVKTGFAPLQVTRVAQYPAATLGFDLAPGVSLGKAVDA
ncbi:MAG TPA: efflux RND transporter permease subunit, partial [Thermoanaerobaculia bacterium]